MGAVIFTREDTGEHFTFGDLPPYQLRPDTKLPVAGGLAVSGLEYMGTAGGQTLASRFQRQTVKIAYNVVESSRDERSAMELIADASAFFQPMGADLSVHRFSMEVDTCDGKGSKYLMQHGSVTVPFSGSLVRGKGLSVDGELDLIFDDPYRYWVDGAGVVSGKIYAALPPGTIIGEQWGAGGLQVWKTGRSQWTYPADGVAGTPQTVRVKSSVPVGVDVQIFGQISDLTIVNVTDGSSWQWSGTIPSGNAIRISSDGEARDWEGNLIVNALGALTAQPGANTFELHGKDVDDKSYALVTIRGAF